MTECVVFADVPDSPKNVECVEVGVGAIAVEWAPPRRDGGAPVRGYIVERRQVRLAFCPNIRPENRNSASFW